MQADSKNALLFLNMAGQFAQHTLATLRVGHKQAGSSNGLKTSTSARAQLRDGEMNAAACRPWSQRQQLAAIAWTEHVGPGAGAGAGAGVVNFVFALSFCHKLQSVNNL